MNLLNIAVSNFDTIKITIRVVNDVSSSAVFEHEFNLSYRYPKKLFIENIVKYISKSVTMTNQSLVTMHDRYKARFELV